MTFSLLDNPFAVLGLSAGASVREVRARATEIGGSPAESAIAALIHPRRRLEAELQFLPGAAPEVASGVLRCVGGGQLPRLENLSAAAQGNVLAHLAEVGKTTLPQPRKLGMLAEIQDQISKAKLLELVTADRKKAGMPAPTEDHLAAGLETLKDIHAAALVAGARSIGDPAAANLLVELIRPTSAERPRRMALLRSAAAKWGRETAAQVARLEENGAEAEKTLSATPAPEAAGKLAANIRAWAMLTGPQRAIDAAASLRHEESFRLARRWHALACDLADKSGAARQALTILCALDEVLGELPDLGARIREDRKAIEALVAAETELNAPTIKALEAAIAEADYAHSVLSGSLDGGLPPPTGGPHIVANLVAAFAAATDAARGEHPWRLMRAFALALHNEAQLTAPALSLTLMMLGAAGVSRATGKVSGDLLHQLNSDARVLRHEHLAQRLGAAIKAGRFGKALALIDRLLSSVEDATDRRELAVARTGIIRRLWARWAKIGLGLAVAALIVWGIANDDAGPPNAAPVPQQTAAASAPTAPEVPAVAPASPAPPSPVPATINPVQPSPGAATLTRAGLLWCLEEQEVLDAARAQMDEVRTRYPAAEYNAAVDQFISQVTAYRGSCYSKEYLDSDKQEIQAQLAAGAAAVRRAGQAMVMGAIRDEAASGQGSATPPASPPPDTAAASPAPAASGDLTDPRFAFWVQQELAAKGFDPGPADGIFGPSSRSALEAFKRKRGISPADDSIDQQTMQALAN